jgi:hypothetical protein
MELTDQEQCLLEHWRQQLERVTDTYKKDSKHYQDEIDRLETRNREYQLLKIQEGTIRHLQRKVADYERICNENERLRNEVANLNCCLDI